MPYTVENILNRLNANGVCTDSVVRDKAIDADTLDCAAFAHSYSHQNQTVLNVCYIANDESLNNALVRVGVAEEHVEATLDRLIPLNGWAEAELAEAYHLSCDSERYFRDSLSEVKAAMRARTAVYRSIEPVEPIKPREYTFKPVETRQPTETMDEAIADILKAWGCTS